MRKTKKIKKPKKKTKESYTELIWVLAKTDFKMRYHGSFLGYIWAILKPLLMFLIMNFVFSHVIGKGANIQHYSLQLITGIILWNFFAEGTTAGLNSFLAKAGIITKIYFPRWVIVIAATLNTALVFLTNLLVLIAFFIFYQVFGSLPQLALACLYVFFIYILIVSFSFIAAPLYLKFRDLGQIWEVMLQALFFASPIVYPLSIFPAQYHKIILANPMGILIHYSKTVLIEGRYPSFQNHLVLILMVAGLFAVSLLYFKKVEGSIAEDI
jgi:lipopolysaccharide transport system permease protein